MRELLRQDPCLSCTSIYKNSCRRGFAKWPQMTQPCMKNPQRRWWCGRRLKTKSEGPLQYSIRCPNRFPQKIDRISENSCRATGSGLMTPAITSSASSSIDGYTVEHARLKKLPRDHSPFGPAVVMILSFAVEANASRFATCDRSIATPRKRAC